MYKFGPLHYVLSIKIKLKKNSCSDISDSAVELDHTTEHQPVPESDGDWSGEADREPGEGEPRGD